MKIKLLIGALAIAVFSLAPKIYSQDKSVTSTLAETGAGHEDPEGYYTCSMHPQVHEHKPGKCPICGMPLVKVSEKNRDGKKGMSEAFEISATNAQLTLVGVGKYTVVRKDLTFTIPAAGRIISAKEVAFQIFESDLQIVKKGLIFSGTSATSPDEELEGQIYFVDSMVDPSSRTIRVIGTLSRSPKRFVLEGSFYGEIRAAEMKQIAIPESAVLHTGKGSLVFVFTSGNKLKPTLVTLGKKTSTNEYQILSGLSEGDIVSTGPNFLIDSEAKIRGYSD